MSLRLNLDTCREKRFVLAHGFKGSCLWQNGLSLWGAEHCHGMCSRAGSTLMTKNQAIKRKRRGSLNPFKSARQ